MRRNWILAITCSTMMVFGAVTAWADHHQQGSEQNTQTARRNSNQLRAEQFINDFDDDGDQQLQRRELPPRMRGQFDRLDQDGNGQLTRQELEQHGERRSAGRRQAAPLEVVYIWINDADQGRLSRNELQRAYDTLQKIDDNGDGELSAAELRSRRQELTKKWARMVAKRLDQNDDQKISQGEAQGTFIARNFNQIDKDDSGTLSREELTQCLFDRQRSATDDPQQMRTGRFEDDQDSSRNRSQQRKRDRRNDDRTDQSF